MAISAAQLIAVVTAETGQAEAALLNVGRTFEGVGRKATSSLGVTAAKAVGTLGLIVASFSVYQAAKYQAAMANVAAYTNLTTKEVNQANAALLRMAPATGTGPVELAKSLVIAASTGLGLAKSLEVVRYSAQASASGLGTAQSVTLALGSAMTAYEKTGLTARQAADYFTAAVRESHVPIDQLASKIGLVSGNAAALGVKFPEVIANIAAMTRVSGNAAQASTSFNSVILSLSRMVAPSKQVKTALHDLGLTGQQVAVELRDKGLRATLQDLADRNNTYAKSHHGLSSAMVRLFPNVRSLRDVFGTAGLQGEKYKASLERIMHATDGTGAASQAFAKIQETFAFKLKAVRAEAEVLGVKLGMVLIPILEGLGRAFMAVYHTVERVVGFFQAHQTTWEFTASIIGGVLLAALWAILPPLIMIAASMTAAAVSALVVAAPFIAIGVAIGAVIFVIVEAIKHWRDIRDVIVDVAKAVWSAVSGAWHKVASFTSTVLASVGKEVAKIWHSIEHVTHEVWDAILGWFKKWWPLLLVVFAAPIAVLLAAWNRFHTQIMAVAHAVWGAIRSFLEGLWKGLSSTATSVFTALGSALGAIWGAIRAVAGAAWQLIKATIITPIEDAWHRVVAVADFIGKALSGAFTSALAAIRGLLGSFVSFGADVIHGIVNGITSAGGAILSTIKGLLGGALSGAKAFILGGSPSRLFHEKIGVPIGQGIANGIASMAPHVTAAALRLVRAAHTASQNAAKHAAAQNLALSKQHARYLIADAVLVQKQQLASMKAHAAAVHQAVASMQADITGMRKDRDTLADLVEKGVGSGLGNAVTVFTNLTHASRQAITPVKDLMAVLQAQLGQANAFGDKIKTLTQQGASKDLIEQIATAGSVTGGALADGLLAGGPDAVKAISKVMGQIADAGKTAGDTVAGAYYDKGIASMQHLVDGMQAKESALAREVARVQAILGKLTAARVAVDRATTVRGVAAAVHTAQAATHLGARGPVHGTAHQAVHVHVHVDGKTVHQAVVHGTTAVLSQLHHVAANGRR